MDFVTIALALLAKTGGWALIPQEYLPRNHYHAKNILTGKRLEKLKYNFGKIVFIYVSLLPSGFAFAPHLQLPVSRLQFGE